MTGILVLSGCTKDIDIEMPEYEEMVMVEGWIINGMPANVILTRNFKFNEPAGTQLYEDSFINGAVITITDKEGKSEILSEIPSYDSIKDYTGYMYVGKDLVGIPGEEYGLTIEIEGKNISASTVVPPQVPVIEIWQEPHPDADNDSMKIVKCKIHDPVGKNYYRYLYKINGEDGASPEISTLEDSYFEGEEYVKAIDSGLENEDQDIHGGVAGYFYSGDTITVYWINADKPYFDFWATVDFTRSTEMSPFQSPSIVPGNVDGALGYWCGLGTSNATIVLDE